MPRQHRLTVSKLTPAYWRVVIENPPINLFDPETFAELNVLMDAIEFGIRGHAQGPRL